MLMVEVSIFGHHVTTYLVMSSSMWARFEYSWTLSSCSWMLQMLSMRIAKHWCMHLWLLCSRMCGIRIPFGIFLTIGGMVPKLWWWCRSWGCSLEWCLCLVWLGCSCECAPLSALHPHPWLRPSPCEDLRPTCHSYSSSCLTRKYRYFITIALAS